MSHIPASIFENPVPLCDRAGSTYSHFLYRYGNPWCSTKTDRNNMHINGFQGDCDVKKCPFADEKQDTPDFLEKTTEPTSLPPRRPNSAVLEGRY